MSDPIDLSERRFEQARYSKDATPLDALKAALRDIESGKIEMPSQIIICVGRTNEDGSCQSTYYNGGSYAAHAQYGLLSRILHDLMLGAYDH